MKRTMKTALLPIRTTLAIASGLALSFHAVVGAALPPERIGPAFDVPYYTGRILPTPKQAVYGTEFRSLATTGILLARGMATNDARIALLAERIERYGGTVKILPSLADGCDTYIVLGDAEAAAGIPRPDRLELAETYTIHCVVHSGKNLVLLDAKDKLGLLWAITAFNQMVTKKDGKAVWQQVEVTDFPDVPAGKRGVGFGGVAMVGSKGDDHSTANALNIAWFAVQFRMGALFFDRVYMEKSKQWWKEGAVADFRKGLDDVSRFLNPLGIEWYVRIMPIMGTPEEKIRSGSEEDFKSVFAISDAIAAAGGNIFLTYDDHRFPMNPEDTKQFGSAREADIQFINRLYSGLKAKHPAVKMCFCPPFYWGPLSLPAYPESRDDYLKAIGERLPKEIGIIWTGPRVKSTRIEKADVNWISERVQRKPDFWQNGVGVGYSGFWWHYGAEPITAFRDWYYDAFFADTGTYMRYANIPSDCISLLPQADFLWNRKAYDPESSIKDAAGKVMGAGNYPLLAALTEKLRAFDIYCMTVNPGSVSHAKEIAAKRSELEVAWKALLAANEPAVAMWSKLDRVVNTHVGFARKVESTKELKGFEKAQEIIRKAAEKETGYDGKGFLLTPYDFFGGMPARMYSHQCEPRLATWIYGAKSRTATLTATVNLATPPEHDYELVVSGQDDDAPTNCRIRIKVNGKMVFEGPNPFKDGTWTPHTFPVQGQFLHDNLNKLTIENIEDSDIVSGPPFFMLNYAVLRPKK